MNTKKLFFYITVFLLIINAQVVYTKDLQDDNDSGTIITMNHDVTLQNNGQENQYYDDQVWKFIEETFQTVTDQTQKIEFCLQQIEQIINANKMKFDTKKLSKPQLLQEIKDIKQIIQTISAFYTKELSKDEAIIKGTCFNIAFINYLLPIFKNNITEINVEHFDKVVSDDFEALMSKLEDPSQLPDMIENNEKALQELIEAGDNVGLTTFNKLYRYLDTKSLPFYGKSTLETAYDVSYWSALGLLAYCTSLYIFTTNDTEIPFLKNYKCENLWLKKSIGSMVDTKTHTIMPDPSEKAIFRETTFGIYNHIHEPVLSISDGFVAPILGFLGYHTLPHLKAGYKEAMKKMSHAINYYAKGDTSPMKSSTNVPKTYFTDMIGGEHLEKLARELTDYLKNPTRYERAGISPATGYMLVGPSQTGKSFFAKALKTLVDEEFEDTNEKVKFATITQDDIKYFDGFTNIFYWARKNAPIILFIDEIDMYGTRRDRDAKNTQELLTAMNGMETDPSKKVIVIAATNRPEELDFALKQKGRLGNVITFDFPTYECRMQYLEKQLAKKNISLSQEMVDTIAQETDGHTYNMIDDIIRQALQLATFQTRPVEETDFETTLDREIRKIKPNVTMSAHEQELVAIYQAGQAAARHILTTDQQIVKITIDTVDKAIKSKEGFGIINENKGQQDENHELLPQNRLKPTRLGFVFTMSKINNHELLSDADQEKELMALLAGQAALELIKGQTFNDFGKEDRAKIIDVLERKISQGTPLTNAMRKQALAEKDMLYERTKAILKSHTTFIKIITNELIKNHTINKKQWATLVADLQ